MEKENNVGDYYSIVNRIKESLLDDVSLTNNLIDTAKVIERAKSSR
jgi:hypothetical protein